MNDADAGGKAGERSLSPPSHEQVTRESPTDAIWVTRTGPLIDALLIAGLSAHWVARVAGGRDEIVRSRSATPWEQVKQPGWVELGGAAEQTGPSDAEER